MNLESGFMEQVPRLVVISKFLMIIFLLIEKICTTLNKV